MLTILGDKAQFCDRMPRRSFLQIGGLAMGGMSLPQILRAQDQSGTTRSHKAVIMIFLSGGPPHQDMVDLKPDAPAEIRGEFKPIHTNVPGIDICEHLPMLAKSMDQYAIIRSLVGSEGHHAAFQCVTGRTQMRQPQGGWPSFGSIVSKLQGPISPEIPPFVGLAPPMKTPTWANNGPPGFLGLPHAPFRPNAEGRADMVLRGSSREQFPDRKTLLTNFDRFRRDVDTLSPFMGKDPYTEQAMGILTSSRLADALDIEREPVAIRDRYGRGSAEPAGYGDAGPLLNDYFLTARRLVEAGARVVSLAYGRWDWHGRPHGTTFENSKYHFAMLDRGLTALIQDLHDRGLDKDVSVVVWGEFGRTPKINKEVGRDHWPAVGCALMAGGGMKTGQVIGATDSQAGYAKERPVTFQEVFATLYHNLGIDTKFATVNDLSGRPNFIVDAEPIKELV